MNLMDLVAQQEQQADLTGQYFVGSRLHINGSNERGNYPDALRAVLDPGAANAAAEVLQAFPGYAPTPLVRLPDVETTMGVKSVFYKDEAHRFSVEGLKSFKVLGAAYALYKLASARIAKITGITPTPNDILSGQYIDIVRQMTVTCATDGNYGRAVAWAATQFGCRAVIYISTAVSPGRESAIARFGAEVRRVPCVYEDAVIAADAAAREHGWDVLSDTAYPGCEELPRLVMQGYTVLMQEALDQWTDTTPPTHVFLQCGVGGFAASVTAMLWERFGIGRPAVIVVEPIRADCAFQSAKHGRMMPAIGDLDTVCAGLSCGELSTDAWEILRRGASAFMIVPDASSIRAMRHLAHRRPSIVSGESSAVGLAGAAMASLKPRWRAQLKLDSNSRVLVFGTEGDTDPALYQSLITF